MAPLFPSLFGQWKKREKLSSSSLLLHFLLKVSEKRKKCDGIEVPEKKELFPAVECTYARMPQKGKFDFQIILQTLFSGAFTLDSHLTQNYVSV